MNVNCSRDLWTGALCLVWLALTLWGWSMADPVTLLP